MGTASGSLGGMTASRNRGGQYLRQRTVPTNPNSTRQAAVRASMAAAVTAWTTVLTEAQRLAWATYAANTPRTDSLGQEIVLTGQQAYVGSTVARSVGGLSGVSAAPTVFNRGQPVVGFEGGDNNLPNYISSDSGSGWIIAFLGNAADSGGNVFWYIGDPVGPGVNFYRGPYQYAAKVNFDATDTEVELDVTASLLNQAVVLEDGERRPVKLVTIFNDGRHSNPFEAIATVAEVSPP